MDIDTATKEAKRIAKNRRDWVRREMKGHPQGDPVGLGTVYDLYQQQRAVEKKIRERLKGTK